MVKDPGFIQLTRVLEPRYVLPSRKYLVDKILPKVHGDVTSCVEKEIEAVTYFSFTTDVWSANAGNASLSLTTHWLTENFVKKSAVLHVQPLEDSHTGEYLAEVYKKMLDGWGISHNQD